MMMTYVLLLALAVSDFNASGFPEMSTETTSATTSAQTVNQNFIQVNGSSLKSKIDSAVRLGRSNVRNGRFYVAYGFNVKPGVTLGGNYYSTRDGHKDADGKESKGKTYREKEPETRNAAVFLQYDSANESIAKVELYDLDRPNQYNGYPVYWAGSISNNESLNFLRELVEKETSQKVGESAISGLAMHNDGGVGQLLEGIVRDVKAENIRKSAVFWLGQTEGETNFLADIVRNDQETVEVRKQGAFAIGVSKDPGALNTLQGLYPQVKEREVKKQVIFAAFVNKDSDQAVDFLINVAGKDTDREARKQAIFWLGQKAGQRSLEVLGSTVERNDEDTEVQKQAVFAISQRKKDESVPMLIKIAKTHQKGEVRKQALFWLGQIDDERALELFKEILSK
jgi:HEAT repeat protein